MAIYMTARFEVKPECLADAEAAITDFIDYIHQHEPDTRLYAAWRNADNPRRFLHVFVFENQLAQDVHRTSAGVKRFTDILYPLLVDGVAFTTYEVLASTGNT
jgi:quinol monooxygenase YgiN